MRPRAVVLLVVAAAGVVLVGALFVVRALDDGETGGTESSLPAADAYHALLVDPDDSRRVFVATDRGLYASEDGGSSWRPAGLAGRETTHLARTADGSLWAAGPDLLARSGDGGATWEEQAGERGLPPGTITALAGDIEVGPVYVALADGRVFTAPGDGEAFAPSGDAGETVTDLAVTTDGVLWAVAEDGELLVDAGGEGDGWQRREPDVPVARLAGSPADPDRLLAADGAGIRLTPDDGATWETVLELEDGAAAVAWSADGEIAYAVGGDRRLYAGEDAGTSWRRVA